PPFEAAELGDRKESLVHEISRAATAGAGREAAPRLTGAEPDRVMREGPSALLDPRGVGREADVARTESPGRLAGADPGTVSARAGVRQVYAVAHNVAKLETHGDRELGVHRKGATRAFPPGHPEIPADYRAVGQPVFIPGSMGTSSFVLAGRQGAMARSFGTTCHGAGRRMSRTAARREIDGAELRQRLEADGITVRCPSTRGLTEEAPFAYKDVERVVEVVERAGLAARVAQLRPIG